MRKFIYLLLFPILTFSQTPLDSIDSYLKQKKFDKAEIQLTLYLIKFPNDLKGIELLGDTYGQQGKWDNAIENYKKLVNTNQNSANYHYKYGGAMGMKALAVSKLTALGMISNIENSFLKAAKLDPKHINTRWALVEFYMKLPGILGGSKSKSLKYAQELENLSKVDGYLAKGYIYEYDEEPELAEKYYKMAITEGGSLWCYDKLTTFYEKQKQPEKALANLEVANEKHQRNALRYQMGKVAAEYNIELQKGVQCLQTYLKNYSPEDGVPKAWAHYRLSQIYAHKKNKTAALKYIDLALAELPNIKHFKQEKQKILKL
ncbi:MAG: tetratricopeptide repeat protein [Flavobacteriaceae bacterium]|jgi:tetratricopeptide (TPR) repeat protein|nr:tetratricopeptide repeat protein [Flavobacteriaceae bacterium]